MINTYTSLHNHSEYSSAVLRFADAICNIPKCVNWCYENGLRGYAISDHQTVSGYVELEKAYNALDKQRPFQHIFANEFYLLSEEEDNLRFSENDRPYYWHYLVIVLDEIGLKQMYELSARAWLRSYTYKGQLRRPSFYSDFEEVVGKDKGHLAVSTGCIGGFLPKCILTGNTAKAKEFIQWNWRTFGKDNFYLECQPCWEDNEEQIKVNNSLWKLHEQLNIPIIVTTDSHFMRPEDRKIHTAFLKSKDGGDSREPEKFYQTTYLFTPQELREQMYVSGFNDEMVDVLFDTTNQIADRVQPITIKKTTRVPALPKIPEFEIKHYYKDYYDKFPFVKYYATEGTLNERYYYYQVEKGLYEYNNIHPVNIEEYLAQINIEMEQVKGLGEAFDGECMADYFTVVQKVVDLIWTEGDSYVGIGRGSAGCYLTNKLLNITGIDPMLPETKEFYPWWRFCSIARSESIFDCDIDIQSFKKERIIQAIKDYFGWRRTCQCVTWGRLSAKTALERAAVGLGIPSDTVGYIKSLIPAVRGSIYSLKDCLYGNEKKGRAPVPEFITEVKKYDDLLETALAFEGMIVSSGVHAGALNVLQGDYTETGSYMVSSNGAVCSQFNLHDAEYAGDLKFDLLSIDCLQTIRTCMELLLKNGKIEDKGSLRDTYNYYLSYDKLDKTTKEMWDLLPTMASAFQYDSKAGKEALRKIGAQNLTELTLANGLMRLAVADGEQPMDMYVRYRKNINEWYQDMTNYGIPQEEQEILKELLGNYCGLMIAQSTMMSVLMDERVCNFNLKESDKARKAVAKKNAEALAETEERLYRKGAECGRTKAFLDYLWKVQIEMSKSYAFDFSHSNEYSTECLQELNLYYKFPKIYWNAAVVITQAGVEDERDNVANTTDYGKIAGSVYKAKENGIAVAPPPVNHAEMSFGVDEANNTILFGLGGISSINAEIAQQIISNRPYASFRDFYTRNSYQGTLITPSKFIQLIKAGCFDEFCPNRMRVMQAYFALSTPRKQTLTTANLAELQRIGCKLPNVLTMPLAFKKYVCSKQFLYGNHPKFKSKKIYWLDERALVFFDSMCRSQLEENVDWWYDEEGRTLVVDKSLDKLFKHVTEELKAYINQPEFLKMYNEQSIKARMRDKLPNMNVNHWSFEALSYYSNEHELACIDADRYNITTFDKLPTEPIFVTKKYGKREWRQYQLSRIMGTVIARNDAHSTITVLDSNNNVVQARFDNHSYPFYKAQFSEQHADGTKTVMDTSWFTRGQGLVLTGYRSEDTFRVKSYKNSIFPHKLQKILTINEDDGTMELQSYRYGYEPKEE